MIIFLIIALSYAMSPPCWPVESEGRSKCLEDLYYSQRTISYKLATKLSEFKNSWLGTIYCQFNDCFIPLSWF